VVRRAVSVRGRELPAQPGCRYGLVGANGSGKTTLLRILAGQEEASAGTVSRPRRLRLGTLEQDHYRFEELPILEVAMMGHHELWQAIRDKEALLERADTDFDGDRYAELETSSRATTATPSRPAPPRSSRGSASRPRCTAIPVDPVGGFKLRCCSRRRSPPTPVPAPRRATNHLDILSIRWLEKFLTGFGGCAMVISHDHRFLDNVSTTSSMSTTRR